MNLTNAWKKYLSVVHSAFDLNTNAGIVAATFKSTKTSKTFTPILIKNISLVMISKPSMGELVQLTTFHSLFGSPLLSQKKSFIGTSGLKTDTPVEIEISDVLKFASSSPLPNLDDFLSVSSLTDLDSITPSQDVADKIRNVAVNVPSLV